MSTHRGPRHHEQVMHKSGVAGLVGDSDAMRRMYDLVHRLADSNVTVLLTGESGTGKELVARALHENGRRSTGPFLAVNCAALTETLLESELFGHVRGAFTDARHDRIGLLLAASGGTLFLDEVGEVAGAMQPKLLRALQERRVRPVGADAELPFDARIVAASNRDLGELVAAGRFREDLFFRLNVVEILLPPLRSRGRDVLTLAHHFLQQRQSAAQHLSPEAERLLTRYRWPGNVRELQNCIDHAIALAQSTQIEVGDLPRRVQIDDDERDISSSDMATLEEVERGYILRVLDAVGGHRKVAASILGVDRKTLYRKLSRFRDQGHI